MWGGIYFAVQTSYEQQLVTANQQALTTAVRQYRTAYQKRGAQPQRTAADGQGDPLPEPPHFPLELLCAIIFNGKACQA